MRISQGGEPAKPGVAAAPTCLEVYTPLKRGISKSGASL